MTYYNEESQRLMSALESKYSDGHCSPKDVYDTAAQLNIKVRDSRRLINAMPKVAHGIRSFRLISRTLSDQRAGIEKPFRLESAIEEEREPPAPIVVKAPAPAPIVVIATPIDIEDVHVPEIDPTFIRWGHFKDVAIIVSSGAFYPTFITGLSGNGKTLMVEQSCAKEKREYMRVQISPETDEDDLLGGFRLIDGNTIFSDGPVIRAMRAGAVLCLDEIDRGSNRIMCLQGVLEGKPILIKKTGELVHPAAGFNVIATANTRGQGSEDGRFNAANILDEAFLERFVITIDQPYPKVAVEKRILIKHFEKFGIDTAEHGFADMLVVWSDTIRKTYEAGGVEDLISTRRLCHIVQSFSIFEKRTKAIELCTARFVEDVRASFLDLYEKIDASVTVDEEGVINGGQKIIDEALATPTRVDIVEDIPFMKANGTPFMQNP